MPVLFCVMETCLSFLVAGYGSGFRVQKCEVEMTCGDLRIEVKVDRGKSSVAARTAWTGKSLPMNEGIPFAGLTFPGARSFLLSSLVKGAVMTKPKSTYQPAVDAQAVDLYRRFAIRMNTLQRSISGGDEKTSLRAFDEISHLVESLPLSTDQYDSAISRLNNCRRYLVSDEFGAAVYELKMLVGALDIQTADYARPGSKSGNRRKRFVMENPQKSLAWY